MKISKTQAQMELKINEYSSKINNLQRQGGLINLREAKRLKEKLDGFQECYLLYMSIAS